MKPRYISIIAALLLVIAMAGAVLNRMTVMTLADDETPKVHDDSATVARKAAADSGDGDLSAFTLDDADGPEGFVPTMMTDLQSADPTSGLQFIAPPTANNHGSATLDYPLLMPPARNGMQPQLSLQYSSDGGSGWLGEGWDIPIPAITVDTRWGVPRYDSDYESETYLLSGQMLAFADASGNMHVAHRGEPQLRGTDSLRHFFPRREGSFSTVTRHGTSPSDYWWEVWDNHGTRYVYGDTPNSRLTGTFTDASGNSRTVIAEWHLSEIKEIHGDYIRYTYRTSQEQVAGGLTAKALYLSTVEAGNANDDNITLKKEPHTIVTFHGGTMKNVRRNSARYGFLTSSNQLLDSVSVVFLGSPLRSYSFAYDEGAFSRKVLRSVSQCDDAGTPAAVHEFSYSSGGLISQADGSLSLFNSSTTVDTYSDADLSLLQQLAAMGASPTALGGNGSTFLGGSAYVGVGGISGIDKNGTAGFSVSYGQGRSNGITTLADMNGDGLPDKVFMDNGNMYFRPQQQSGNDIVFGAPQYLGMRSFARTKTINYGAGLKDHGLFEQGKVTFGYDYGHTKTQSKTYLTDVNGDGLTDIADHGTVWFCHLDANGHPVYTRNSSDTPNAAFGRGIVSYNTAEVESEMQAERDTLLKYSPMQDAVRVWRAPRAGLVSVSNSVSTLSCDTSDVEGVTDGVRLSIQHQSQEVWSDYFHTNSSDHPERTFHVEQGDSIFFRVQSGNNLLSNAECDRIWWNTTINYTDTTSVLGPDGYYDQRFISDECNVYSARVTLPLDSCIGIHVGGRFTKPATSDDIELRVYTLQMSATGDTVRVLSASQSYAASTAYADALVSMQISVDPATVGLECEVWSSSNVAWEKVKWLPEVETFDGSHENHFSIPALYHMYLDEVRNATPYVPTESRTYSLSVNYPLPISSQTYTFTLTAKTRNGLVFKNNYVAAGTPVLYPQVVQLNFITLQAGEPVWFDVTCDDSSASFARSVRVTLISDGFGTLVPMGAQADPDGKTDPVPFTPPINVTPSIHAYADSLATASGGPVWRGWSRFTYNAANGRFSRPIETDSLSLPVESSQANPLTVPYAAMSVHADGGTLRWQGPKSDVFISGDTISVARLAENNVCPVHPLVAMQQQMNGTATTIDPVAPVLESKGYSHALMGTAAAGVLSPISSSGGTLNAAGGRGHTSLSYMDMNGDGYPDIVTERQISYTNSRGVLSGETGVGMKLATANANIAVGKGGHPLYSHTTISTNIGTQLQNGTTAQSGQVSVDHSAESKSVSESDANSLAQEGKEKGDTTITTFGADLSLLNLEGNFDHAVSQYVDINGDGLPDRVYDNGTACLNLGYGFTGRFTVSGMPHGIESSNTYTSSGSFNLGIDINSSSFAAGVSTALAFTEGYQTIADINGDGLPDKLRKSGGQVWAALNLGNRFAQEVCIAGLDTLSGSQSTSSSANTAVTFSSTVIPAILRMVVNPSFYGSTSLSRPTFDLRDIDGDGFLDMLSSQSEDALTVRRSLIGSANLLDTVRNSIGGSFAIGYSRSAATTNHPGGKWVMTELTVDDGIHDDGPCPKTRFEYLDGCYDRREREFLGFGRVLTRQLDSEHGDALYRTLTETYDVSSYHTQGLPLGTLLTDAQGRKYSRTQNTYYRYSVTKNSNPLPYFTFTGINLTQDEPVAYCPLKFSETLIYDDDTDSITTDQKFYEYQTVGPTVRGELKTLYVSKKGNLSGESGTNCDYRLNYQYAYYFNSHCYGLPRNIYLYLGNTSTVRRRKYISYNTSVPADIAYVNIYRDAGVYAQTRYTYDNHGNVLTVTLPQNNSNQRQQYTYTYDNAMGMYPVRVNDVFGYESSAAYDYRFGIPISKTDINGYSYAIYTDCLGRITGIHGPNDDEGELTMMMEYQPHAVISPSGTLSAPAYAVTHHYDYNSNTDENGLSVGVIDVRTTTFVDGFGRPVQTKKDADVTTGNSSQHMLICSGRTKYDALGRTIHSWYPTTADTTSLTSFSPAFDTMEPATTTFDVLDRIVSEVLPDGSATATSYDIVGSNLRTVVTDALGNKTASYTNGAGNTVRTERRYGTADVITTQFFYDNIGQLTTVRDCGNNTTNYQYNWFGLPTSVNHPASGTTTYTYDRLGNVLTKKTANFAKVNKVIRYTYDYDRLKQITYPEHPENNVILTYGSVNMSEQSNSQHHALGRVVLREDGTGATEYFYDYFGNINKEIRSVVVPNYKRSTGSKMTASFTTEYVYDSFGRILTVTFPDGEMATYLYDCGGQLQRVLNGASGEEYYVSHIGYDKFGQRISMQLGDGTATCYSYNPERRWLQGLDVSKSSQSLINNTYAFDPVGNITQATIGQTTHSYQYDDLYRLTSASGNYLAGNATYSLSMAYDNLWRITSKQQSLYQNGAIANGQLFAGYDLSYQYNNSTMGKHFQLGAVYDSHFRSHTASHDSDNDRHRYLYDLNGNLIYESIARMKADGQYDERTRERRLLWDEENRLLALSENGYVSNYWYDADGERTLKMHGANSAAYINGGNPVAVNDTIGMTNHDHYTLYANPYFTLADDSRYMKHIYIGGERIATEAGTLSPQFGTYQSGDVASKYLRNAPVDYSAKYDAQQLAYQSAYAAFGVPLNGCAPPASKTAGYVKNSALPTLNGLNMAGYSMGETESSDEIDGVSETEADEVWDDNESWEEEAADYTAVDNEESQVEESTDEVSAEETSSIADANESMRLLTIGSSKICEGVYFFIRTTSAAVR